jgi:DNA helicase-2/ATP-dependent DNA helicase PcrA
MQPLTEAGLNPQQRAAVLHREGPLLVLAGAGSGKTRIVTQRIAHLLRLGIPASQILAVTFTNKAAGEMAERVRSLTDCDVLICTFHSLGARILREAIPALGYERNFTIYDEDDSEKLLKSVLQTLGLTKEIDLRQVRGMISQAKNACLSADEAAMADDYAEGMERFPDVYRAYQAKLKECNAVDFDDLLYLPARLFREHPHVLEHYQARWQYLMIDEYQDTNTAQYIIAKQLVAKTQNLFVVGDPDQSIYSWRGADIQNILNFERDFVGAQVIRLEQNYRSRNVILQAANALIGHNSRRFEKRLWSDRGEGERIGVFIADHEHMEADFVVEQVKRLRTVLGMKLRDMCVFYRTNFQSRVLEDVLLRHRIPYQIVGGLSFYLRKEIKDLLAYLKVVQSDCDAMSLARTINLPKRGIGDATLQKLIQGSSEHGVPVLRFIRQVLSGEIAAGIRLTAPQKEGLFAYLHLIDQLRELLPQVSLQDLLTETVARSGYLQVLKEDPETAAERKENIDELIAKASEWDEQRSDQDKLQSFLEELSLKGSADELDPAADSLNMMTIHNGKGLEFRAVFLVGLEEDLFPHLNAKNTPDGLEEERRLCYVGVTRAEDYLFLSASHTRFLWGGLRSMRPSRFLQEIPREYLQRVTQRPASRWS